MAGRILVIVSVFFMLGLASAAAPDGAADGESPAINIFTGEPMEVDGDPVHHHDTVTLAPAPKRTPPPADSRPPRSDSTTGTVEPDAIDTDRVLPADARDSQEFKGLQILLLIVELMERTMGEDETRGVLVQLALVTTVFVLTAAGFLAFIVALIYMLAYYMIVKARLSFWRAWMLAYLAEVADLGIFVGMVGYGGYVYLTTNDQTLLLWAPAIIISATFLVHLFLIRLLVSSVWRNVVLIEVVRLGLLSVVTTTSCFGIQTSYGQALGSLLIGGFW